MPPREDKHVKSSGNETNESSPNLEGKLNDFLKRIKKYFQMMPNILVAVSFKVLQTVVKNIWSNKNFDTRSRRVADGMDVSETSQGLGRQDKPLRYPVEPRDKGIPIPPLDEPITAQTRGSTQRAQGYTGYLVKPSILIRPEWFEV